MSISFGYLIPKETFEVGKFKTYITSVLESQEIIDGYYEEEYQWFAAGKNSHSIFKEGNDDTNPAFEYVEIHDTVNNRIIPDCTVDDYGGVQNSIGKGDAKTAYKLIVDNLPSDLDWAEYQTLEQFIART
jgi:hypothetical protein